MRQFLTVEWVLIVLISLVTSTLLFLSIPKIEQLLEKYLVQVVLLFILVSIVGLIFNKKKLMFTGLICAGTITLHLKNASNVDLRLPNDNDTKKVIIAHINLSAVTDQKDIYKVLEDSTINFISFQELTPSWAVELGQNLKEKFKYQFIDPQADVYGKAIYSNLEIRSFNKNEFYSSSSWTLELFVDNSIITIVSIYLTPPLDSYSSQKHKEDLKSLHKIVENITKPKIVLGEFNQVYWSKDIINFRNQLKLYNSRRSVSPMSIKMPFDHIFFSEELECIDFKELDDQNGVHIGSKGVFQIKSL